MTLPEIAALALSGVSLIISALALGIAWRRKMHLNINFVQTPDEDSPRYIN